MPGFFCPSLQKLPLPDADTAHMLFLLDSSSKETRRQKVMQDYKVIRLLGDNLTDFSTAFEKKPMEARKQETDQVKDEWGRRFIVLPNAIFVSR
jgi:5'-nucleotidase (lipoprotein e(P4) family)